MRKFKRLKCKLNEIVMKTYVIYTMKNWEIQDEIDRMMEKLRLRIKREKGE